MYNFKKEREIPVFDENLVQNGKREWRKEGEYMTDSGPINSMNRDAIRDDAK